MSSQREPELTPSELEVLKVLWDHGPTTVREVRNHLLAGGRELAYTTVLTFLTRLEQKGYVTSDRASVAYVYGAAVSREKVTQVRVDTIVDQLFDGSVGPLVLQLVQNEQLSSDEISELQRLVDRLQERG